jgi:two-component system sensor histidine kinase DesK
MSTRRVLSTLGGLTASAVWLFPLAATLRTVTTLTELVGLVALGASYTVVTWAGYEGAWPYRLRLSGVALVAALGLTLALAYGPEWLLVLLYVGTCGTAVWAPAPRPTLLGLGVTEVAIVAIGVARQYDSSTVLADAFGTVLAVGVVYTMRRADRLVEQLQATRQALAEAAVAQERLRFSRDLHDLLGHTLSLIVVKAEAVRRLVAADPATAATQARDIEEVGRRALGEIRDAVAGYRDAGLQAEIAHARRILAAAGVALTVQAPAAELPTATDRLFGWVVREAATNVVRHSRARNCAISVGLEPGQATVDIRDDGAQAAPAGPHGFGLRGLAERLAAAGGCLHSGPCDEGGFRVTAQVPVLA